jgi:antitoxin SocA-like protein
MVELKDVILNVLRLAGPHGVNRTMLVKIIYFTELEGWRRFGRAITGTPFRLYHYGAWAPEVQFVAEKESNRIAHSYFQGFLHFEHNYKLRSDEPVTRLPHEVEQLLREVWENYGGKTAAHVGELSKQTEPMEGATPGHRLDLSVVAPRTPGIRVRSNRIRDAYDSLDFSQRGTRREIQERDLGEIQAWAPARRRASRT